MYCMVSALTRVKRVFTLVNAVHKEENSKRLEIKRGKQNNGKEFFWGASCREGGRILGPLVNLEDDPNERRTRLSFLRPGEACCRAGFQIPAAVHHP